jgi:hypothetical protein
MSLFGLPEAALWVLRVIAAIGGVFVGWFVSDPLARVGYRLIAGKPIPGWTLPWIKITGALVLGLLVYYFIPLGGGPGGWGYGPGLGGGPGKGPGEGGGETQGKAASGKAEKQQSMAKDKPGEKSPEAVVRKPIEIEVLGGKRYPGDNRYYVLRSTDKAMTLLEVEGHFKEHGGKLELRIIVTSESPDNAITGVTDALRRVANQYQIPSLVEER